MPYKISKMLEVENAHMLSKHPDDCKFPHGHSRKVEFVLESKELDENDMVCDFKAIKHIIKEFVDSFDHAICINTDDPHFETLKNIYGNKVIEFAKKDPTTEVIAKRIFDTCKRQLDEYSNNPDVKYRLSNFVKLIKVRVWETSSSWAEYCE